MKCKNIECENEVVGNRVYCSLKCRNVYVNKHIRNYNTIKNSIDERKNKQKDEYLKNPKKCKNCDKLITFEKRMNNYCDQSCSAIFTNKFRKGVKKNFSEEGLNNILEATRKKFHTDDYYENPKRCLNCNNGLEYQRRNKTFCNIKCKKEYYCNIKEDFELYYPLSKFKFDLKLFNDEFDFSLIEKYGWYKAKNNGDNINGVSRDHRYSVKEGFRKLINPLLLSHPANCELIVNRENQSKSDKCSLTINELLKNINIFELKYGKYYKDEIEIYIEIEELRRIYKRYFNIE